MFIQELGIQGRPLGRGPFRAPVLGDGLVCIFKIWGVSAEHVGIQARPLVRRPLRDPVLGDGFVCIFKIWGVSAEHEGNMYAYKPVPLDGGP